MMGTSHAITGAAAWIAITATALPAAGIPPLTTTEIVAGTIVSAGAALLPDADHPSSTVAHAFPGGTATAGAISALTGGHRKGMHSLLAVLALFLLTPHLAKLTIEINTWPHQVHLGPAIAIAACTAFALKTLRIASSWPSAWIIATAAAIAAPRKFVTVVNVRSLQHETSRKPRVARHLSAHAPPNALADMSNGESAIDFVRASGLTPFRRSGGSESRPVARGFGQGDWSDHVEQ